MSNISIIIFFVLTASGGVGLLTYVLQDKKRPIYLVVLHAILASASFGMLAYNVAMKIEARRDMENLPYPLEAYAFVFFSLAAMGGIYMLVRDKVLSKGIPKWIPFIHGGLALTGLIILIIATMKNAG